MKSSDILLAADGNRRLQHPAATRANPVLPGEGNRAVTSSQGGGDRGDQGWVAAGVYLGYLAVVQAWEGLKRGPCACPLPTAGTRVTSKPCSSLPALPAAPMSASEKIWAWRQ